MKVILLGSFAGNNAGDMVVLESIVYDFARFMMKGAESKEQSVFYGMERDRNMKLVVPALNKKGEELLDRVLGELECVEILPVPIDKNPYHILKALRKLAKEFSSAQYIYTTAGILFDQKIWNPLYNFVAAYTPLLIYAKKVNPSVKIIGYNVGITIKTRTIGKWMLKKCIRLHDRIYLREAEEAALPGKLQYKGDAFVSADNVFGYHKPVKMQRRKKEKETMYINLTLYGVKNRKLFLREVVEFVNRMKENYEIYFFQTSTRDLQLAEMICKETLSAQNHVYSLSLLGYDKICGLLSECDILVGMRMHAVIFALKQCCPVIAINYSSKAESLMKTMHLEEFLVPLNKLTAEMLVIKVNSIQNQRAGITEQLYDGAKRLYLTCNQYK